MSTEELIKAVVLGLVQGIAEFLPISSSGHIIICDELLNRLSGREVTPESSLQLNVAVHLGTLCSILIVYRHDVLRLMKDFRLCLLIVLATIPVVVTVLLFYDSIKAIQTPLTAGIGLFVTAVFLFAADYTRGGDDALDALSPGRAGIIGCFQAVAIVPGISRSGSTISGGLLTGLRPEESARFSFLIAIPAILGAVVFEVKGMLEGKGGDNPPAMLLIGAAVAFVVGWICLRWLLALVRRRKLRWFGWYCLLAGTATVVWQLCERI